MSSVEPEPSYRAPIHVHIYFWAALVLASLGLPYLVASALFDTEQYLELVATFVVVLIIFQAMLWFARERCSAENLSVWNGLLYITAYMTVGMSSFYFFVAVPCAIIAILMTVAIGVSNLVNGDQTKAQRQFQLMVAWFGRHRMIQ